MSSVTLSAPAMFADHHVLKARASLLAMQGVQDVYASSAWKAVIVSYDPDVVQPEAIQEALSAAGYPPDQTTPILAENGERFTDPAWEALGVRTTRTNQVDLHMSGEFRKY